MWDHVTLTPEEIKIIVFNKGTPHGLNTWIPAGGQQDPSSTFGDSLAWKKAQKKERKKKTSEVINNTIPQWSPNTTILVWRPWKVPSRETSRHHWRVIKSNRDRLIKKRLIFKRWNHLAIPKVRPSPETADRIGHGDSSTRW